MSEERAEYATSQDAEEAAALMGWSDPGPKEIATTVSGYTPAPDALAKKFGYVTAMVWGRMWRYCQGRDGVCRAKLETIATELGMSERTIIRHVDKLVTGGYFVDRTPELKNRPHLYADTGKLRLAFSTDIIESGVTESQRAMTESHREGDRESVEDSTKRGSKNKKPDFKSLLPQQYRQVPELKLFMNATAWIPGSFVLETVYDFVHAGLTEGAISAAFKTWTARGYKPANVEGYLTWARDGIPPAGPASKHKEQVQASPVMNYTGYVDPNEDKYVPMPDYIKRKIRA